MTFTMTRAEFELKKQQVEAQTNEALHGDAGQLAYKGVFLRYEYTEPELSVTLLHKPLVIPESMIEEKMREWFAQG